MPDVSRPDHLPHRRPDGQPPPPSWLPRQRRGVTPQMIGRYPDFNVLDTVDSWDPATRKVVLARLDPSGPMRFFTVAQQPTLCAFCDTVLAQDSTPRIPVGSMVDAALAQGRLDGFQYIDMPDDRDTWRQVLAGLDHSTHTAFGDGFADVGAERQEQIVGDFATGSLDGGPWDQLNVRRAYSVVTRAMLAAFYSHPWAWNEIGFGGPAYPRGFMRLGGAASYDGAVREPFETPGATDRDPVRDGGQQ